MEGWEWGLKGKVGARGWKARVREGRVLHVGRLAGGGGGDCIWEAHAQVRMCVPPFQHRAARL